LSILDQDYGNKELIIIDGGSTDKTLEIIRKYNARISFWRSEKDNGIYDAWNKALVVAKGNWISFIGSGDRFLPNALYNYSEYIKSFPKKEYISSKVIITDSFQKPLKTIGKPWSWNSFKRYMNCAHVGSMHSCNLFKKYGKFNSFYKIAGDYEFLLRANNRLSTGFINIPTATMLGGGISSRNFSVFKEAYNAKDEHTRRNKIFLIFELYISIFKFKIKKLLF
jgi:glycosyltransferase involved in cell wall biosynthesis